KPQAPASSPPAAPSHPPSVMIESKQMELTNTDNVRTAMSTLAESTASVLAVLLASVAAFYVFLQDRSADFNDRIEQARFTIRDSLLALGTSWINQQTYVPVDLNVRYRELNPTKSEVDLAIQAMADLSFEQDKLGRLFFASEAQGATRGPWLGRF